MTLEEIKLKGLHNIEEMDDYLNRSRQGFFFLPESLTEIVAEIVKLNQPINLINLNSNIGEILSKFSDITNCLGLDINLNNVEIANYLYPNLNFRNENPIDFQTNLLYDCVICFPPLGQRIESNGRTISIEKLYINKSLELLKDNGSAIFLLPPNILTAPYFEDTRSVILAKYGIKRIISLPQGIIRNAGIELAIVEVSKRPINQTDFFQIKSEDLPSFHIKNTKPDFVVSKNDLYDRWDFNFHNPANKSYEERLSNYETKKIEDLVEIIIGVPFKSEERLSSGNYQIISPRNVLNGVFKSSPNDNFIQKTKLNDREKRAVLKDGDIVIPRFNREDVGLYFHNSNETQFIANQHLIILRGPNAEYVTTYLNTEDGIKLFNQQIKRHARGNALPTISLSDLRNIQIPILPIGDLEFASKRKLEKLSYEELLSINQKYISLKSEYLKLKNERSSTAHEAQLNSLQKTLEEVLSKEKENSIKLDNIDSKLVDIQSILIELSKDFNSIKSLPREIDEKISRLNESIDKQLSKILQDQKQLDFYIIEIKRWFDYYDILEMKSQKYLPEAEYIFDHISKLENPDYSPFILQYCRALENELLNKIFRSYVQSLIDRNLNLTDEFAWDFGRKDSGKLNDENTFKLGKHIQKCLTKSNDEWFFELGSMEVDLRYLTGRTVKKSPLLQDLKTFVLNKFEQDLLNIEYLDEIKAIIRDYRNQSAHPNIMDSEKALKFHIQMKECLINLMENYKK